VIKKLNLACYFVGENARWYSVDDMAAASFTFTYGAHFSLRD
jgi:hypothetical protein